MLPIFNWSKDISRITHPNVSAILDIAGIKIGKEIHDSGVTELMAGESLGLFTNINKSLSSVDT